MTTVVRTVSRWPKERGLPDVIRHAGCRPVTSASLVEVATLALFPVLRHLFDSAPSEVARIVEPAGPLGRFLAAGRHYDAEESAVALARWLSGGPLATAETERYRVPTRVDERVTLEYVCRLVHLCRQLNLLASVQLAFCWCPTAQALTTVPRQAITDRCVAGGLTLALVTRGHR